MALARREALILGAIGAGAAVAGALLGALALQAQSGAADLLAAPFRDLSGARRTLREWRGRARLCHFLAAWGGPPRGAGPVAVRVAGGFAVRGGRGVAIGRRLGATARDLRRAHC